MWHTAPLQIPHCPPFLKGGFGTEGGQSLIRAVPTGACPHFHDAASPVRRHWRTGTPCCAVWEPSHSSSPAAQDRRLRKGSAVVLLHRNCSCPFSLSVRFSNHWCGLQRPGEFSPQSGRSAGHWIRHGQHATLRNLVLLPTLPGLIEEP